MQGCLGVIIMHCYGDVGSKHNLANHCRNKFHYHCSYAFPVQFKITEVCGDWFLNEWLPGDRCVFVSLGLPLNVFAECFFFWCKHKWSFSDRTGKKCANRRKCHFPFLCLFISFFFFFATVRYVTSLTHSLTNKHTYYTNLWICSIDYIQS